MKRTLVVLLGGIIAVAAQAASPEPVSGAVAKLEENLRKIEASIGVTKQRLKAQRETQFAPDLYSMLAELLQDKASTSMNLKREKNPKAPAGEVDLSQEKRITQEAIETYKIIEDRYPQYTSMDRVLFTIAQQYKILALEKDTLAYLKKVAERFPGTTYGVKAQIEIGDIFFARKDYEFALQQFEKALVKAQEPERSLANHKAGQCLVHLDRFLASLKKFEQVFRSSAADSDTLKEEALVASVWPLLELSPHETLKTPLYQKPIEYYRRAAGDKHRFRRALARLAQRFELKKRRKEAAEASLELFRLADDLREKKAAFETAYTQLKALKTQEFPVWMGAELRDLVLWMQRQTLDPNIARDVAKYEAVYRDLVTTLHRSAMGTRRKEDLATVAQAYEDYLAVYGRHKKAATMRLNQAEAYYLSGQYAEAGQAYLKLVKTPKLPKKKELLESSLEAFLKGVQEPTTERVVQFQSRDGYREAAGFFQKNFAQDPKLAAIRFNAAKTYYDEQRFDEAAAALFAFISAYPGNQEAQTASLLYLDCYYLRDQMKDMIAAGKKLAAITGLSSEARVAVQKASSQAELKAVRSIAGEFSSQQYATKFREFAKKNKGSSLGEQALYEAFTSLKAQNQAQAFDVGEEYVASYGKSARAKEVLLSLSQLAISLLDYPRAASYMGAYAQRYPQDADARTLALQAGQIYEHLGQLKESVSAYQMAGDSSAALKALFKHAEWKELSSLSSGVAGVMGQYYQGLSLARLGRQKQALSLLERVAGSPASSPEEKEMVGHAAVIVAELNLKSFVDGIKGQPFSAALLQSKVSQYQSISSQLQTAVDSGDGRWVIAGLYNLGKLNRSFAGFLNQAPAQVKPALQGQIQGYARTAKENFDACLKAAEDNEVVTSYSQGCRGSLDVTEMREFAAWPRTTDSRAPASVSSAASKDPRSPALLRKTAEGQIRSGHPAQALLVLARAGELAPGESANEALTGVAYLHLRQYRDAQSAFQRALAKNAADPLALRGMAGLMRAFGLANKERMYRSKKSAASDLHPWLK